MGPFQEGPTSHALTLVESFGRMRRERSYEVIRLGVPRGFLPTTGKVLSDAFRLSRDFQ